MKLQEVDIATRAAEWMICCLQVKTTFIFSVRALTTNQSWMVKAIDDTKFCSDEYTTNLPFYILWHIAIVVYQTITNITDDLAQTNNAVAHVSVNCSEKYVVKCIKYAIVFSFIKISWLAFYIDLLHHTIWIILAEVSR